MACAVCPCGLSKMARKVVWLTARLPRIGAATIFGNLGSWLPLPRLPDTDSATSIAVQSARTSLVVHGARIQRESHARGASECLRSRPHVDGTRQGPPGTR